MKVTRDKRYESGLLKKINDKYREEEKLPDGKWHVYDATFPRKTVACKLFGCPQRPQDVGFFFLGKSIHAEMQRILGIDKSEVKGEKFGIVGTMDYKGKDALEIKSSRKWTVPDHLEPRYVRQVGYYAVVHNLPVIYVPIVYPTAGRTYAGKKASSVDLRVWKLEFTKVDMKEIEYDLKETIKAIEQAIKKKSFKGLPPSEEWLLERFDGKVPTEDVRGDLKTLDEHPFWYAWQDHGKL
jgi:hypothetical protein